MTIDGFMGSQPQAQEGSQQPPELPLAQHLTGQSLFPPQPLSWGLTPASLSSTPSLTFSQAHNLPSLICKAENMLFPLRLSALAHMLNFFKTLGELPLTGNPKGLGILDDNPVILVGDTIIDWEFFYGWLFRHPTL
ncbi:hypothetical protein SISNIDRAFT_482790 [Sistotremastrum niveocremeum HHB9708]|uniref:Uncharacterized protein n=1 Tax=Sistotremastrum niveocremeum HHB9708 TaxID=1314777 RepID=A0A164YLD0_9AGAM|nr:hypothetical protein SISNIDRAFT_482790 [Sistotremastrum niveocremeum HHB9708]